MTVVMVPSFQLGLTCTSSACECGFGAHEDGAIGLQYRSSLTSAGITIAPSVFDYLSAENFANAGDSVAEAVSVADASALSSCAPSCPVIMSPAPELLGLVNPITVDLVDRQRMLGGSENPAFGRAFESMRRMQRRSGAGVAAGNFLKDMSMLRRAVISDIGRGCDMVSHRFGKNAIVIPAACPSFVDADGVAGWRMMADGRTGSSNAASRSALSASLSDAASLSGLGAPNTVGQSGPLDLGSQPSYRARSFCFHMSSGYPMGCSALVDGTALPNDQTYRQATFSSISSNFNHQALTAASRLIFKEVGLTVATFAKRLMSPPTHIAVSGVSHDSSMSSSWYGMLSTPSCLVDDMVRHLWLGMADAGLEAESLIIADDMERLLSIATSSSHPQRYAVRRCLEHQFLHRKLRMESHVRTRVEGGVSSVSSLSWSLQQADPDMGTCLPDDMWCDLEDANGHDWKSLIGSCSASDSNWQAYRYSRPGLSPVNPFTGMRITPSDFNSYQASSIAALPSLGAREVVDMIRWEFVEWTRQVGIHMVNLIAAKGRYIAANTESWKTLTHGQVEV